ncbi:hypothetical protein OGAPHI_000516 [Ogataea philodendri]|uniref:CCAAT-binding factor domain-containing protein n=2 Tax=Saccharomycotina TaxID=147537 RepID=A0A9P8PFE6_9ASCO|nr:uncharacterized protein OGAPHI_000516 [Ogataea philodendri]KAH3671293.1 hypothetical protein OGAPHI_000516 [Ogataea philodendri]
MELPKLNLGSIKDKVTKSLARGAKDNKAKPDKKKGGNNKKEVPNKKEYPKKEFTKREYPKKEFTKKEYPKKAYPKKEYPKKEYSQKEFTKKENQNTEKQEDVLRREALALGATDEDLKLLEGINDEDSEQEFDGAPADDKLKKELSKYMKGLEFDEAEAEAEEEVEEEELEEEEDEEQVEEEEEEEEAENEEEKEEEEAQEMEEPQQKPKSSKLQSLQTVVSDKLVVTPRNDWFNETLPNNRGDALNPAEIEKLYTDAKRLFGQEQETYMQEFNKSSSQKRFLSQVLTGGTLNDKISALTLLIQESPLHNHKALETMFAMCDKKSRTAALQCIEALADLFVNGVLPADRKLLYFNKQPLTRNSSPKELIVFYFEDYLKKKYFQFIGTLEKLLQDSIVHVRTKVIGYVFSLLKAKPEQEANLLRIGVNKLGDQDNKVASKTSYHVLLLQQEHPAMKEIVVDSIFDVLFRKNNDHHAIYYSTLTLNQTILTRKEDKLANKLMDAYFKLFEKLLVETDSTNTTKMKEAEHQKDGRRKRNFKRGKKGGKSVKMDKTEEEALEERNSKMFAAILTGLNRAFPFSNLPASVFKAHLDTLFQITHSTNFNTSIQALMLIHRIVQKEDINRDRYYRTLYESLLDERVVTSSKQGIYLNLLFQSLKEDTNKDRVMAFVKRICQNCLNWINIGSVTGMMFLLIELEKDVPEIRNLIFNAPVEDGEQKPEYDSRKRDPQFSNAQFSSLWELNIFSQHYHPTVTHYTEAFFNNQTKDLQKPNLGLFTLAHFLDRFVYKKAKMKPVVRGQSIMQPLAGAHTGSMLVKTQAYGELPTNTEDWINKKAAEIQPEDRFFYEYFSTKQEKALASKMDKELNSKLHDDEEESDIDEDTVWNALVKSNPEVEGPSDDDLSDFDMSEISDEDLEELDEEEADEDDEDEEGLVTLKTVEDLGSGEEEEEEEVEEEEEEEDAEPAQFSDSSDSDVGELLGSGSELESDEEPEQQEETEEQPDTKKRSKQNAGKSKKLKSLPTFASADDYANYLDSSDDEY